MRRYGHAVLGGTFDHLHVGHAALLTTAFRVGRSVSIGLTTDRFLALHPKPFPEELQSYRTRRRALSRWLGQAFPDRPWRLVPLADPFGRSVELGVDVLVVSVDTHAGGKAVNAERRRLHRPPLPLVLVPVVLADDLGPVSSRRVREGAIDRDGRRLLRIEVGLAVTDPMDRSSAEQAIRRVFPSAHVVAVPGSPGPRPSARDVARALSRAAVRGQELGVGVARARDGSWVLSARSPAIELPTAAVPFGPRSRLARAIVGLLRPALERKAFAPRRSSPG